MQEEHETRRMYQNDPYELKIEAEEDARWEAKHAAVLLLVD